MSKCDCEDRLRRAAVAAAGRGRADLQAAFIRAADEIGEDLPDLITPEGDRVSKTEFCDALYDIRMEAGAS